MLEKNDLILLNEIIYKVHSLEAFDEMRLTVLSLLKHLIPYNQASFYLASNRPEHLLSNPVAVGISEESLQNYIEKYEDIDYTRWIFMSGKSMAYRETDLFSDAKRESEVLYKEMYAPVGIHYSAQLSISLHDSFLGIISLYRNKADGDFSDDNLFILELLKEHLAFRLYHNTSLLQSSASDLKGKTHYDTSHYITQFHLTVREVEVLGLLLGGLSGTRICEVLCISPHTLKKHTLSIYKKLSVSSRWELFHLDL
ncbi:LuxR C-terminal-related transcriptional regulator [Anoxybacterium hadale]|uniref:LuxR C-terminal-related transcriptional regulator n=1 Tax=Anoxybacterium hadale TaxID=3408580 RepID=UPI003B008C6A